MLTNALRTDADGGIDPEVISLQSWRTGSSPSMDRRPRSGDRPVREVGNTVTARSDRARFDLAEHIADISPPDAVARRTVISDVMTAEIVQATSHERFAFRFRAPLHLLVVYEQGARRDGETSVEGLPRSTLRDFAGKLVFVPAGHEYHEWQDPQTPARLMYLYFDPAKLQRLLDVGSDVSFAAKLFFEDATLLATALKLKRLLESPVTGNRLYVEALGAVLLHELIRINRSVPQSEPRFRGGLAAWQQRVVIAHIDAHLDETIPLATLAQLARLSPHHFCRAFKQSFGEPPHRYHTSRRMERAKALLAKPTHSVTDVGFTVGYSETSSFCVAFRKSTGLSPRAYRRAL